MLSAEVEYSINTLFRDARDKRHEFVTVEHVCTLMIVFPLIFFSVFNRD